MSAIAANFHIWQIFSIIIFSSKKSA